MNSTTSETRTNTINEQNDNKISLKDLPALMVNESNIVMHKNLNVNGIIDPCPAQKIKTLVTGGVAPFARLVFSRVDLAPLRAWALINCH